MKVVNKEVVMFNLKFLKSLKQVLDSRTNLLTFSNAQKHFRYIHLDVFSKDKFAEYKNDFIGVLYLFIFGFASLAIMIFSPNFPARTATPFTCALIACISGGYFILKKEDYLWRICISLFHPRISQRKK